ncbi:hypothetical protein G4L39_03630 [Limisphaera ngatamarikiensis]|uniref:Cytochrome C Planctomycete-type domain-containing protein n=1 Tax=Limisphaera ngatamarikiensis TaxID=1324935 RepID=A0A6M1RLN3_9BACT|nr:c-type cytochrome domain-containing protein [Limisphaera ngatamarikiensis]NGO38489.1 hypothetical protein [Limisphaera ngatamarikiensis]
MVRGVDFAPAHCTVVATVLLVGVAYLADAGEPGPAPGQGSMLPPPASRPVDFQTDIRPILDRSCLRCHGPERPKGGLRLDTRDGILAGGDGGPVVVLSNSAASRLIHAVARSPEISEDLWMPPEGRAPALTPEEVGLLRAWIDQGLPGSGGPLASADRVEVTLGFGWNGGSGPGSVFRARWQQPDGWNGGVEELVWTHEPSQGPRFTLWARALREETLLQMDWLLPDWGRAQFGASEYRWYGLDRGHWPVGPGVGVGLLDTAPQMDIGRAWVIFDLDRPRWPLLRLGYEHEYRDGTRALDGGSAAPDGSSGRLLWPSYAALDEESHTLQFRVQHQVGEWWLEDEIRLRWTDRQALRTNALFNPPESGARFLTRVQKSQRDFQAANAFRFDRPIRPWLRATGGYLYSRYDGDAAVALDEAPLNPAPAVARRWRSPSITLEHSAHVGNVNLVAGPQAGWTVVTGVQTEWTRHQGLGRASFDYELAPEDWFVQPTLQESARDRFVLGERVRLQWDRLPRTILYAEGAAEQNTTELFEDQPGGDGPFRRDTAADGRAWDARLGLETTLLNRFSFGASYRWRLRHTDFEHRADLIPTEFGDFPNPGYSAFIRERRSRTDQVEVRLTWQPALPWRTAFLYRHLTSRSETATDALDGFDPVTFEPVPGYYTPGSRILGAEADVHAWTLQLAWRPARRWSFHWQGTMEDHHLRSALDDEATLPAWAGRTCRMRWLGRWSVDDRTDAELQYEWGMSDFHRDTAATVLPTGLFWREHLIAVGMRRRFTDRLTVALRYGIWRYDEPGSGGANDVFAHLAWMSLGLRWP